MKLGEELGADVPYCIKKGTALCEGMEKKVTELKRFKDKIIVIVQTSLGI